MASKVSRALKRAIKDTGASRYRIAKDTSVAESTLSRFVNGRSNLDLATVDKLAEYFELELVTVRRRSRR